MSVNTVALSGNLTRDAELRSTSGGMSILSFGLAVNERRKDASGNWADYANFFDCDMFGARAEKLASHLTKGTKVAVAGKLHYSSWQDRNTGQRRSKVSVTVNDLEFTGDRQQKSQHRQQQMPVQQGGYNDDDIPF